MNQAAAFHAVHLLHEQIEDWFNARTPATALEPLMAHFSTDFSMVGMAGMRLDRNAVRGFFAGAHGSRPGLRIHVDALAWLPLAGDVGAVRYREVHRGVEAADHCREALALFVQGTDGALLWRALHETAVGC